MPRRSRGDVFLARERGRRRMRERRRMKGRDDDDVVCWNNDIVVGLLTESWKFVYLMRRKYKYVTGTVYNCC